MPSVIVTGANRGIGLEFVRQYKEAGWDVIGTVRETSRELEKTGARVKSLDMQDLDAVERFGRSIKRLDLLIANAGTYGPRDVPDAEAAAEWSETFVTNTIAPFLLAKSLLPAAAAANGKL